MWQAADQLLLTREAIAGVARRSGLLACFLPKLEPEQCGTGAHCHISLCNVLTRGLPPVDNENMLAGRISGLQSVDGSPGTGAHCHISLCHVRARSLPSVSHSL